MIRQSTAFSLLAILLWAQPQTSLIPPSKDNTLFQSAFGSLSNGAGPHVFVGQTNQGSDRHAVLAFDIAASIPGGSTIQSVTLTMEMDLTIAGATTVTLHPLTQDWGEGTSLAGGGMGPGTGGGNGAAATTGDATWLHAFSPSSFWNTPGGDFIAAPSATTTVDQNGLYTWSGTTMVGDVQGWLDNPGSNFGWLLDSPGLATPESKRFRSREHPEAATRPLLNVTFLPPSGASVTSSGFGCPVACGGPGYALSISAPPVIGGTLNAIVANGHPAGLAEFFLADAVANAPVVVPELSCLAWIDLTSAIAQIAAGASPIGPLPLDAAGGVSLPVSLPNLPFLVGSRIHAQATSVGGTGVVTSNAIVIRIG